MKKSKAEITPSKNNKCDTPVDSKDEKDSPSKYPTSNISNELTDYVYFVNYRAVVVKTKHYYATQNSYILFGDVFKIYNLKGEIKKIHAFFPGDQNNLSDTLIMLKTTIIAVTTSKAEALRVADEIEMICKICHKKRKATKFSIEGFLRKVRCDTCRVKPKHFINKNNANTNNNTKQKNNNYKNEPIHDSMQSKKNCISCNTITDNYSNSYNNTNSRLNLNTNKNMTTSNNENRHNANSNNIQDKININNYLNDGNTITINNNMNKEHGCQYNTKYNNNNNSIAKNYCYTNNIESYNTSALLCDNNINTNDSGSNKSINNLNDYKNKDEIVNMIVELIKYISWMQKALIKATKGNYSIDNSEINIDKISQIIYSAQLLCNKLLRQKSLLDISNNNNTSSMSSLLPYYNTQNNNLTMESAANSVNTSSTATSSNTATTSAGTGNDATIKPKYSNLYAQKMNTINKQNEINNANANSTNIFNNFINQNSLTTPNSTTNINRNTRNCILNTHSNNNNTIEGSDQSNGNNNNNTTSNNGNTNCSENSNTSTNDNNSINEMNDKKSRNNKSINNKIINDIEGTDNINNMNTNNHTDINSNINSMNNINNNLDIDNINTYNNINCSVIPYHTNNCQVNCLTSLQSDRNYTRLSPFIKNENNYLCLNNKNNDFSNLVTSKNNYYTDKQDIVFSALSKQYNSNISFSNINNTVSNFYKAVAKNYNIGDTILNFEK
ncbi:conserved Plasmodium protein, unknown function [Plasmodium chabaudi chabaudi]|uniref:Uncharacterized protein n=1 Tax=Plasmodium chabaudi chabaudi TaxID=31271 RepID=A0A1C6YUA5_PLACU|nr:conserved Plasmodium protein, unknown function [Plasmodium chabaudi chabaudi]